VKCKEYRANLIGKKGGFTKGQCGFMSNLGSEVRDCVPLPLRERELLLRAKGKRLQKTIINYNTHRYIYPLADPSFLIVFVVICQRTVNDSREQEQPCCMEILFSLEQAP
jgi:hypothetical protein